MADMASSTREDGQVASGRGPRAGQPKRRTFTAAYKIKILERYDQLEDPRERGALLRREGLYHSHIEYWRQAGEYRGTDQVPDWAVAQEGGEPGGDRWQAGRRGRRGNSVSHEPVAERRWQRGGQARDARILNNARRNIGSATWCSIRAKAASRATPPLRQPSTNGLVQPMVE